MKLDHLVLFTGFNLSWLGFLKNIYRPNPFFFLELIDHLFIIIKIDLFDVARLSYKSSPSGQLKAARCALLCIFSRWFSLWLFWSSHHTPALVLRRSFSVPFIIFTGHQLLQFSPQRILSCTYEDDAIAEQQRSAVPRSDRRLLLLEKELDNVWHVLLEYWSGAAGPGNVTMHRRVI